MFFVLCIRIGEHLIRVVLYKLGRKGRFNYCVKYHGEFYSNLITINCVEKETQMCTFEKQKIKKRKRKKNQK